MTNTGTQTIDLTGFRFVRDSNNSGIDYEFQATDASRELRPGEFIVIAGDRTEFQAAYAGQQIPLAEGQFNGRLSNGGERLTLVGPLGETVQSFSYDDAWHITTDGRGRSLVIVDSAAALDQWNVASGWRASLADGGSPGRADEQFAALPVVQDTKGPLPLALSTSESSRVATSEGLRFEFTNDEELRQSVIAILQQAGG